MRTTDVSRNFSSLGERQGQRLVGAFVGPTIDWSIACLGEPQERLKGGQHLLKELAKIAGAAG
jgi:hypothetical protein